MNLNLNIFTLFLLLIRNFSNLLFFKILKNKLSKT